MHAIFLIFVKRDAEMRLKKRLNYFVDDSLYPNLYI